MEIGAKQYDKEGPFFGPQNVRKSRRAKMDLPVEQNQSTSRHGTCRCYAQSSR